MSAIASDKAFKVLDSITEKELKDFSYEAYINQKAIEKAIENTGSVKAKNKTDFLKTEFKEFVSQIA